MNEPAFFSRRSMGQANYLLVAIAATFLIALIPIAAYKAVRGGANDMKSWLPASEPAVANLNWCDEQFDGDQMILASWDGCTLGNAETLDRVARNLSDGSQAKDSGSGGLFTRVTGGSALLAQLTSPPFNLSREAAVERLEGTFIGRADGAHGAGNLDARPTCLAAFLSRDAAADADLRRQAVERLRATILSEANVTPAGIHLAGPGMDSIGLDEEAIRTLARLGALAITVSFGLCAWRLRNLFVAAIVVGAAAISAGMSLALVFYCGVLEVTALDRLAPWVGSTDALVTGVPVLVFVLALSMGFRLVYYYRDARLETDGDAAERGVGEGRPWWLMTPLLVAAIVGVLCTSDIVPIRRFSVFAGVGLVASVAIVLALVPVLLHRFPLSKQSIAALGGGHGSPPRWTEGMFQFGAGSWFAIMLFCVSTLALAGWGLMTLNTSAQLPAMAGARSRLAKDYAWFGERVGHAAPLDVVIDVPIERCRRLEESAEADGQQYRLSLAERLSLIDAVSSRMRAATDVSGVWSPGTVNTDALAGDQGDEELRHALERQGLMRFTRQTSDNPTDRELWRLRARVTAAAQARGVDYEEVLKQVRAAVEPVLRAYEQRDLVVRNLHERGGQLSGAKVCILFADEFNDPAPARNSPEQRLGELLNRSGVAADGVKFVNLEALNENGRTAPVVRERALELLEKQTAVVRMTAVENPILARLADNGVNVVNVGIDDVLEESQGAPVIAAGGVRPIRATFAGMPAVAAALSAGLLPSVWAASQIALVLLAAVMVVVAWDIVGGVLAVLPIVFPLGIVVGMLGWMEVRLDTGLLLPATLAIGLAVEGAVNFIAWFRRGSAAGLFRHEAARMAYARMAPGMLDTLIVGGVGLLPLALSGIASIQLLALLAAPIALTAMIATLSLLPGMVCSPLAAFFGAVDEPQASEATLRPISLAGVREDRAVAAPGRPHVAAAAVHPNIAAAASGRTHSSTAEARHEGIDAPHLSLHTKLQRLRHSAGDSSIGS